MSQLSRPYQIALLAIAVIAAAWFAVSRLHGSGSTPPTAGGSPHVSEQEGLQHVYNGPAPGLHGLSEAVKKAHETAASSERERHAFEGATAEAHEPASPSTQTGGTPATGNQVRGSVQSGSSAAGHSEGAARRAAATVRHSSHAGAVGARRVGHSHPAAVHRSPADTVARELHEGRVVLLLFWNPYSSDDVAVHGQVQAVAHAMGHKVAVQYAKAGEVGAFGTVTRDVSVYQTPTLLVIGRHGLTTTVTGLTDAFSIEQDVREARHSR